MPKVLISDKISEKAVAVMKERGLDVDYRPGLKPEELKAAIGGFDGLAVRSATKVTADLLEAANGLTVIGRAGIGVDNIDVKAATENGVVVMNTPFGNAITTAEHAIAMMFALARRIPEADRSTQSGQWEKSRFMGVELTGKTLGIIGCGNIGSIVAERAHALKMKVSAYDPFLSTERAEDLGVEKVELDVLFRRADFISLHVPLTDATRNIIDKDAIAQMKPGVRIINCARGGLLVDQDVKAALESGQVAGVALDVFAEEPPKDNVLFGMENVVATPHLGASTTEAQEKVAVQVAEQLADFLLTGAIVNAINMPSVSAEDAPKIRPYMKLAQQLGSFAGQLTRTGLKAVAIEYEGEVAALNTRPITAVALEGLLSPLMETVNMVNAPVVARERNIDITEVKHQRATGYQSLICITVTTEQQSRGVAGALFGDEPRLVSIKGINIEASLTPHMIYITNEDMPGIIGNLGNTFAEAGINIATFHLGRSHPGGDAISLLQVDEPVPDEVLAKVRKLPNIRQVTPLSF
ncbi:MAG: phosphoglycerate dehydrogenase [Alphaproteobacteria bacterium]|nr:phosphoglycerate dehydrogenase [Alphaproteobacteria bacterium]